jgi:hypothetical protein
MAFYGYVFLLVNFMGVIWLLLSLSLRPLHLLHVLHRFQLNDFIYKKRNKHASCLATNQI